MSQYQWEACVQLISALYWHAAGQAQRLAVLDLTPAEREILLENSARAEVERALARLRELWELGIAEEHC